VQLEPLCSPGKLQLQLEPLGSTRGLQPKQAALQLLAHWLLRQAALLPPPQLPLQLLLLPLAIERTLLPGQAMLLWLPAALSPWSLP
jgi:hypothetical protein